MVLIPVRFVLCDIFLYWYFLKFKVVYKNFHSIKLFELFASSFFSQ